MSQFTEMGNIVVNKEGHMAIERYGMGTDRRRDEETIVTTLAAQMRRKLELNRHKGDWRENSPLELYVLLIGEAQEAGLALAQGLDPAILWAECGDIGNYAAMLADVYARQKKKEGDA